MLFFHFLTFACLISYWFFVIDFLRWIYWQINFHLIALCIRCNTSSTYSYSRLACRPLSMLHQSCELRLNSFFLTISRFVLSSLSLFTRSPISLICLYPPSASIHLIQWNVSMKFLICLSFSFDFISKSIIQNRFRNIFNLLFVCISCIDTCFSVFFFVLFWNWRLFTWPESGSFDLN